MKSQLLLAALSFILLLSPKLSFGQSPEYEARKKAKIAAGSVFTKIIKREAPATIVYEDADVIAFVPLRPQAPVHFLIVPKKEIPTVNDVKDDDVEIMGKLFMVAKQLAEEYDIAASGYRLAINTNEDSGQSVFHIHMHLMGGMPLGPMVDQTYRNKKKKK